MATFLAEGALALSAVESYPVLTLIEGRNNNAP
jgi:hypothetical protein